MHLLLTTKEAYDYIFSCNQLKHHREIPISLCQPPLQPYPMPFSIPVLSLEGTPSLVWGVSRPLMQLQTFITAQVSIRHCVSFKIIFLSHFISYSATCFQHKMLQLGLCSLSVSESSLSLLFFFFFFFCLHWVFIVKRRLSLVSVCQGSCPMACGILVPQPGIEPVSPALEGRFLTTGLTGKSRLRPLQLLIYCLCIQIFLDVYLCVQIYSRSIQIHLYIQMYSRSRQIQMGTQAFPNSFLRGFPGSTVVKNPPANAGDSRDADSFPGLGKSPGVGNGNLLHYSGLEKIHGQKESGGLQSMGPQRIRHD